MATPLPDAALEQLFTQARTRSSAGSTSAPRHSSPAGPRSPHCWPNWVWPTNSAPRPGCGR